MTLTDTPVRQRVLVVDDEQDIRELLGVALARMQLDAVPAETVAQARQHLSEGRFALCLTDMRLPDGNGIQLVEHIQQRYPQIPVAVITAYGNAQAAVDSLKAGAFDFVSKPLQLEQLHKLVEAALKLEDDADDAGLAPSDTLLGNAPAMVALRGLVARVARSQAPLHISGESGTGKERVARLVHQLSARADGPFVPVNCGAIPSELMESELFGHVKGAFTGALRDKAGLFQTAEGGTLFLDEVAELPLTMQVKLLRALQERVVRPVGDAREIAVNVRIISATNEDLAQRVADGEFRQDLYYRLNVIGVQTPPLRDHPEDIPLLAQHILGDIAARSPDHAAPHIDAASIALLRAHDFPGNVRELENILERAVTLCDGEHITPADLQLDCARLPANGSGGHGADNPAAAAANQTSPASPSTPPTAAASASSNPQGLEARMQALEREAIVEALEATRWNRTRAAEKLGLSFRQLRYKIRKLGIE